MSRVSKYFWPASRITEADMALLYQARQASNRKTTISQLIAVAIREQYGRQPVLLTPLPQPEGRKAV